MCQTQKEAWFNLMIVVLALVTVLALYPFLGQRASGGFGMLGFLGLSPLFFWKRGEKVLTDERDHLIQRRSAIIAYTVFWVAFVTASTLGLMLYGGDGAVPVPVLINAVWLGFMLVIGMRAIATLALYGRGDSHARLQ